MCIYINKFIQLIKKIKYHIQFLLLCIKPHLSLGQINLVPNPGFESMTTCPHILSEISDCLYWHTTTPSPDYFNRCAPVNSQPSVPQNALGFQEPYTGNGYIGVWGYLTNYREYVTCELINLLSINTKYY